ncbi:cytochrome P450 4C1-like [Chrysoperla carnea]|uniref:cytochrome P450 4C1-like n=1 Tax=Chrysoperla carnea TaxID=189513 RepID=UPI001D07795A|nr:cytochrome P450 4C1-like [Chrysoperla carnea]
MILIILEILILLASAIIAIYAYNNVRKHLNGFYHKAELIPGPQGHFLLGSIREIVGTDGGIYNWLVQARKKYGPVLKFWALDSLHVMLADPKDVELILKSQKTLTKSYGYNFMRPLMGEGLVTSAGEHWREHRKIITPTFHFNILEKFVETFNENAEILIKRLTDVQKDNPTQDIHTFLTLCALDIICETAMGTKINAQQSGGLNDYVQAVNLAAYMVVHRYYNLLHRFRFISKFTPLGKQYEGCLQLLLNRTDEIIRTRKAELKREKENKSVEVKKSEEDVGRKRRMAFLDLLLQTTHTNGSPLSDTEIRDEVNTFMVAGHETTSIGTSTCLYLLSINPEVQEKVVEELNDIFGNDTRAPSYEDLQKLSYLERTIKESQRLMPSIAEFQRYIKEDFPINNYVIPGGSTIGVMVYAMHIDPEIFPDPMKFDPDRFLPENSRNRHPFAYIPFSGGYRNCIGQKFAMLEMKAVISSVLRNFKIEAAIDEKTGKVFKPIIEERVTTGSKNGIYPQR